MVFITARYERVLCLQIPPRFVMLATQDTTNVWTAYASSVRLCAIDTLAMDALKTMNGKPEQGLNVCETDCHVVCPSSCSGTTCRTVTMDRICVIKVGLRWTMEGMRNVFSCRFGQANSSCYFQGTCGIFQMFRSTTTCVSFVWTDLWLCLEEEFVMDKLTVLTYQMSAYVPPTHNQIYVKWWNTAWNQQGNRLDAVKLNCVRFFAHSFVFPLIYY